MCGECSTKDVDSTQQPEIEYRTRLAERLAVVEREERRFHWIGNLRLAAGISAAILCFFVFGPVAVSPWWLCLPVSVFLALVVIHSRVVAVLDRARRAARFYERGLARIEGHWAGTGQT